MPELAGKAKPTGSERVRRGGSGGAGGREKEPTREQALRRSDEAAASSIISPAFLSRCRPARSGQSPVLSRRPPFEVRRHPSSPVASLLVSPVAFPSRRQPPDSRRQLFYRAANR